MSSEQVKEDIYEEIGNLKTNSLIKKALFLQKLNEKRSEMQDQTYEKEYLLLKHKYELQYAEILKEISKIIKGESNLENNAKEKGISDYWLKALDNSFSVYFKINDQDKKILIHLKDLRINYFDDMVSYKLEFVFSENEYFSNQILSKTYFYDSKSQKCTKIEASVINWKGDDKIPNKIIKKVGKSKAIKSKSNNTTTIVETFFDFFKSESDLVDDQVENEEGRFFIEDLIPYSMEYYLGLIEEPIERDSDRLS